MFAVVEFRSFDEDDCSTEVAVIPFLWLHKNEKKCYWPNRLGGVSFATFVRNQTTPKTTWPSYKISKVYIKSESYDAADEYLNELLRDNRLDSVNSGGSVRSLTKKYIQREIEDDSTSEEEEIEREKEPIRNDASQHSQLKRSLHNPIRGRNNAPSPQLPALISVPIPVQSPTSSSLSTLTTSTRSSNFEENMIKEVSALGTAITNCNSMLQELLSHSRLQKENSQGNMLLNPPADMPEFPVTTLEAFSSLNEKLKTDNYFRKYMVTRLGAIGGSGVEAQTRRIMKFLFTNDLAVEFNWKGRNNKKAFETTEMVALVLDAAKLHFPQNERSDFVVCCVMKDWLKFAKARSEAQQKKSK